MDACRMDACTESGALDLDLYMEQIAQADNVEDMLSVFEIAMIKVGFVLTTCHLVTAAYGQAAHADITIKLGSGAEDLHDSPTLDLVQINQLVLLATAHSGAFQFSVAEGESVAVSVGDVPGEGVCIPLRGVYGSFAIALARNVHHPNAISAYLVECIDAIAAAFYRKYCVVTVISQEGVRLTGRELDVLRLVSVGETKKSIADSMGVTNHAIDFHYRNIMKKYKTTRIVVAVVKAIKEGVI